MGNHTQFIKLSAAILTVMAASPNKPAIAGNWPIVECRPGGCEDALYKRQIAVIEGPGDVGTATIIGRTGNVYTFLTSEHAIPVKSRSSEYAIYSPVKKKRYPLLSVEWPMSKNVDIAVGTFRAPPGDSFNISLINAMTCVSKDGDLEASWCVKSKGGRIGGYSKPSEAISIPMFRYNEFALKDRAWGNRDGYEFTYESATFPGMSGSPIFGETGTSFYSSCSGLYYGLIAIHGRSEGYETNGQSQGRSGVSLGVPVDLIREYLLSNAKRLGIPSAIDEVTSLVRSQYCDPSDVVFSMPSSNKFYKERPDFMR